MCAPAKMARPGLALPLSVLLLSGINSTDKSHRLSISFYLFIYDITYRGDVGIYILISIIIPSGTPSLLCGKHFVIYRSDTKEPLTFFSIFLSYARCAI
jgi:hypothetical protein